MKFTYSLISILLSLLLCTNLSGQLASSLVPLTATANPSAYGFDAPTISTTTTAVELSKKERQRFQRSLVRRADDLVDWDLELDDRQKTLYGRNTRTSRRPLTRNPLPARLLSQEDLYAWESRLDKLAERLSSKDTAVQQREAQVALQRGYENLSDRDYRRDENRDDTKKCNAKCCKSKEKE